MQKTDLSVLLQKLLKIDLLKTRLCLLCDQEIIETLFQEKSIQQKTTLHYFSKKDSFKDFLEHFQNQSLFDVPSFYFISLPDNVTPKKWTEETTLLSTIQNWDGFQGIFFGGTTLKNKIQKKDFPCIDEMYLCYSPNENEFMKCIDAFIQPYSIFKEITSQQRNIIKNLCLENYGNDLSSINQHFLRMEKIQCNFEDAFLQETNLNVFSLIDAFVENSSDQLLLRLNQLQNQGIDCLTILGALFYFLKQMFQYLAQLKKTQNSKLIFDNLHIPFPAQGRILKAAEFLKIENILLFMKKISEIEFQIKTSKQPYSYLSLELLKLY